MATVAHHIHSNYNPDEDKLRLELETGQLEADAIAEANPGGLETQEDEDPWITERPFGTSVRVLRPPRFVPAAIEYNEWGSESVDAEREQEKKEEDKEGVASWYRSLARKTPSGTPGRSTPVPEYQASASTSARDSSPPVTSQRKNAVKRDRNNWFIARALEASASASTPAGSSGASTPVSGASTPALTPTLADILERNPPPLPTEEKYKPPVWLAIGPSNKGFAMLQKSGWEEGEVLGRAARNRSGLGYKGKGKEIVGQPSESVATAVKQEKEVIDLDSVDHEIVDLTLSDDEDEERSESTKAFPPPQRPPALSSLSASIPVPQSSQQSTTDLDHAPRALLTPLPTVLKSDRLGIGRKAKYTGSGIHRVPVKRVTHSQASLEAHARAADKQRRMKKLVGRGRRGFERISKSEQERRKALMAYLNT